MSIGLVHDAFSVLTRFVKTILVLTKWQGTLLPPINCYTNKLMIHVRVLLPMIRWLLFLGLFSQACLMYSSAWVIFKWQWCDWTNIHLVGNCHTTGQWICPSNYLLFVISRAQMGLEWDYLVVFSLYGWKNLPLHGSLPLLTFIPIWSFVILV